MSYGEPKSAKPHASCLNTFQRETGAIALRTRTKLVACTQHSVFHHVYGFGIMQFMKQRQRVELLHESYGF